MFLPGNEADYVIVSVVRSARAGFLNSPNRMNVLLTRCRKGLVIVSNRNFLDVNGGGSQTLLGKLVAYYRFQHPSYDWTDWRSISSASVDLPGVAAPNVVSKHNRSFSSYPVPISVSVNMQRNPNRFAAFDISDINTFPRLAPKMPLLKGNWANTIFSPLHPLSHVHRRRNGDRNGNSNPSIYQTKNNQRINPTPQRTANDSKIPSKRFQTYANRTQFPFKDTNHNATRVQRPYLEKLGGQITLERQQGKNTKSSTASKRIAKSTSSSKRQEPKSPKSESTINAGFIRSIVIHEPC